jgi:hypothetical protein
MTVKKQKKATAPHAFRRSACTQLRGFSAIGDLTDSVQVAPAFYTLPLDNILEIRDSV